MLTEKWGKRLDDPANQVREILKRFEGRFTADNPRMVQRYVESRSKVLVHLHIDGFPDEFVAAINHLQFGGPNGDTAFNDLSLEPFRCVAIEQRRQVDPLKVKSYCDEQMMLVGIVQLAKLPEGMSSAALVRFGCVDCVYGVLPNSLYISGSKGSVLRGRCGDGVMASLQVLRRREGVGINKQLIDDMIEGTAEVLQYVGGNGCKLRGDGPNRSEVIDALSSLRIYLDSDFIRVGSAKGDHCPIKILDVLFGPCDFRSDAIEPVRERHCLQEKYA